MDIKTKPKCRIEKEAYWKSIVQQCNERPEGQSVVQWLAEHGIKESNYYYWLPIVRDQVMGQASNKEVAKDSAKSAVCPVSPQSVTFAELPFTVEAGPKVSFKPVAVVQAGKASVAFSGEASTGVVSAILQEVLSYAK